MWNEGKKQSSTMEVDEKGFPITEPWPTHSISQFSIIVNEFNCKMSPYVHIDDSFKEVSEYDKEQFLKMISKTKELLGIIEKNIKKYRA
jgi:hypothetical protein